MDDLIIQVDHHSPHLIMIIMITLSTPNYKLNLIIATADTNHRAYLHILLAAFSEGGVSFYNFQTINSVSALHTITYIITSRK